MVYLSMELILDYQLLLFYVQDNDYHGHDRLRLFALWLWPATILKALAQLIATGNHLVCLVTAQIGQQDIYTPFLLS